MANPQLDDGYTRIANEILEALCWVNLSKYEWRVLICLIRKTYGWKKKIDWISLSKFSKETGLDRRHAHRAIKSLLDKGIVVICRDDKKHPRYGFQKDYEKWKMPPKVITRFREQMAGNRERRKRKSASRDDKMVPLEAPTKTIFTKETLKEKEERDFVAHLKNANSETLSSKEESHETISEIASFLVRGKRIPFRSEEWLKRKEELKRQAKELGVG